MAVDLAGCCHISAIFGPKFEILRPLTLCDSYRNTGMAREKVETMGSPDYLVPQISQMANLRDGMVQRSGPKNLAKTQ